MAWRFFAASALIFLVCRLIGVSLRLTPAQHRWAVLQGISLFGPELLSVLHRNGLSHDRVNRGVLFDHGDLEHLGRRAVVQVAGADSSGGGCLRRFLRRRVAVHARCFDLTYGPAEIGAIFLCFLATLCASFGNLVNARNQKAGIGLWQGNAWGMLYGAIATLGMAIGLGKPLAFDFSWPYVTSLAYLVVFGSVAAFGAYLALLHRAGPEKAAFASLLFPVVALTISTVFEDYQWSVEAVLGVALILGGNRLALKT